MPPDFVAARDGLLGFLSGELIGPWPVGEPLDCSGVVSFPDPSTAAVPRTQAGTGEEILQRDPPSRRYGIGVLYPQSVDSSADDGLPTQESADAGSSDLVADTVLHDIDAVARRGGRGDADEGDPFDMSGANEYQPSSMGVSVLVRLEERATLAIAISGGRYRRKEVKVGDGQRTWWLRQPVATVCELPRDEIATASRRVCVVPVVSPVLDGLRLNVEALGRPYGPDGVYLVTVCLVNRTDASASVDEHSLFQCKFTVGVVGDTRSSILPYPGVPPDRLDEEEQRLELLFRRYVTYAVGHGCSADWECDERGSPERIVAEPFPMFEQPSVTPVAVDKEGRKIRVPMSELAGLGDGIADLSSIEPLLKAYRDWIALREADVATLEPRYHAAAVHHLAECRQALERMHGGVALLKADPRVLEAFTLANRAVLIQQVNGARKKREVALDPSTRRYVFSPPYAAPSLDTLPPDVGDWRAFQIAFVLMCLSSIANGEAVDRESVELLWFPTGGGKTEAYLALAAFAVFLRRLRNASDTGTQVLMRYTLRLLTTQQFQRAARLICAMEWIRSQAPDRLGRVPFSIGIWLGRDTTPNDRADARATYRSLVSGDRFARNKFLLDRCPWCKAPIGPREVPEGASRKVRRVLGLQESGRSVVLHCSDGRCFFGRKLPVQVVDEEMYAAPPDIVIGTVDKFAVLAWRPEARALFGVSETGARSASPPGLIIQDELHLISGPLGSMVGLYECLVEELCTDRRHSPVRPKIVCSTATIRRYREQTLALYRRARVSLFPPPGLDVSDSFFSREAKEEDGARAHGRVYVGVNAPSFGSLQTVQVRTLTALLQAPMGLAQSERDPWWTLLVFFNSLRELGGTLSLLQSDIPDRLKVLKNRLGIDWSDVRRLHHVFELTGRLENDEVPEAIDQLEQPLGSAESAQDVCLASNIIEVGVDIDRLSLLAVIGQPKTTAQYIQVTGRVGRRWWERPGVVVTVYSASKARDRSHYEHFRAYHERLYAQVEPTSVTPFSRPVLERALHAVLAAYVRQCGDSGVATSPEPFPAALVENISGQFRQHLAQVDPAEASEFELILSRRLREWKSWRPRLWTSFDDSEIPLLHQAGGYIDPIRAARSWPTPTSLRNVDAECEAEISSLYIDRVP
jgi:hypothetical protein